MTAPTCDSHLRLPPATPTDGRTDGRTNEDPYSPFRDISPFVTRTRTYGFSADSIIEAGQPPITKATRCPDCGGRRTYGAARCRGCYEAQRQAEAAARRQCVECGGQTSHDPRHTRCWNCYRVDQREKDRESREAFTEDVRWLLDCGTAPVDVCARMGINAEALARRLRRYGEHDLARPFERLRNDLRRAAA